MLVEVPLGLLEGRTGLRICDVPDAEGATSNDNEQGYVLLFVENFDEFGNQCLLPTIVPPEADPAGIPAFGNVSGNLVHGYAEGGTHVVRADQIT